MKHIVTITKQDFLTSHYESHIDDALCKSLRRQFPKATHIETNSISFNIILDGQSIARDFDKCDILSDNPIELDLEDLIYENHISENPQEVQFAFYTI